MIFYIHVGVALKRPPAVHEYRRIAVEASGPWEAEKIATQMAACTSVMPVRSLAVGDEEFPDWDGEEYP